MASATMAVLPTGIFLIFDIAVLRLRILTVFLAIFIVLLNFVTDFSLFKGSIMPYTVYLPMATLVISAYLVLCHIAFGQPGKNEVINALGRFVQLRMVRKRLRALDHEQKRLFVKLYKATVKFVDAGALIELGDSMYLEE